MEMNVESRCGGGLGCCLCFKVLVHKYGVSRSIVMGGSSPNSMWWRDIHKLMNGGVFRRIDKKVVGR